MRIESSLKIFLVSVLAGSFALPAAKADTVVKNGGSDTLNMGAAWVGGVIPGGNDIAQWTTGSSLTNTHAGSASWYGISIDNPDGDVTISAGTINLGAGGITVDGANATITSVVNATAPQTWTIGSGYSLSVNQTLSNVTVTGGTLNLLGNGNDGTFTGGVHVKYGTGKAWGNEVLAGATIHTGGVNLTFERGSLQILNNNSIDAAATPIYIKEAVTGNGTLVANNAAFNIEGADLTNFTGTFDIYSAQAGTSAITGGGSMTWKINSGASLNIGADETTHFGEIVGSGTIANGRKAAIVSTIIVGEKNTTSTFSGTIKDNYTPTNGYIAMALTKKGSEKLILSGSLNYHGDTLVEEGTLEVNTSLTASTISVAEGAKLAGNGIFGSATTGATIHGTLAPGSGDGVAGNMTFKGSLLLDDTATLLINSFADSTNDIITLDGVSAVLTLGGNLIFNVQGPLEENQQFDLVTLKNGGSIVGSFDSILISLNGVMTDGTGTFDSTTGQLTITQVPEPGTVVFLTAGVALIAARFRRKVAAC